jgi:hypothetical protein
MKSTHNTMLACGKSALTTIAMVTGTALIMAACSTTPAPPPQTFTQDKVVQAVQVPSGNVVAYETTAVGSLDYECRSTAGSMSWVLVAPSARLYSREGREVGSYSGPPAKWTMNDGSSVTGTQVAVSPVVGGIHIPLQLSTGASASAPGSLQNVTYIQRLNTKNGQDFVNACTQSEIGNHVTRPYQANYIFWKAA